MPSQKLLAPVHGHEGLHGGDGIAGLCGDHDIATSCSDLNQITGGNAQAGHVFGVHVDHRLADMAEQASQIARAAHAVPLVTQAPRVQGERKVCAPLFRQGLERHCSKLSLAARGGVDPIGIQPQATLRGTFRHGPLLGPLAFQYVVAQACDVEVTASGRLAVLVPDGLGLVIVEQRLHPRQVVACEVRHGDLQPSRKVAEDVPVMACLAQRRQGGAHPADAAFRVGHRAIFFTPGGGRQQHVRVGTGGCGRKGFLHNHELSGFQRLANHVLIRHRLRRVGAGYPQCLDLTTGRSLEHFNGGFARFGRHVAHLPQRGDFRSMFGLAQIPMGAQQVGHAAHFAATHGIGLTCEREGACTGLANLPCSQVQVDQCRVLVCATGALVEPLAVQRQGGGRSAKPAGGLDQVIAGNAAHLSHRLGVIVAHKGFQRIKPFRVLGDVVAVHQTFCQQNVQHAVEQRDVGTRLNWQVQVGHFGCFRPTGVNHDELHRWIGLAGSFNPTEQDRVGVGGVGARNEDGLRVVEIFVAGRRRIGAQRDLVAGDCTAHAQAGVGVDVVGANQAFDHLVEDVIVLGQQLACAIETNCTGAVFTDDGSKAGRDLGHGLIP